MRQRLQRPKEVQIFKATDTLDKKLMDMSSAILDDHDRGPGGKVKNEELIGTVQSEIAQLAEDEQCPIPSTSNKS